ncbi:muconolactone Delta-isomerase [Aeromicrobium sp.]|uniref:muconolactone Delta-isomerase n=1 Tax=Aeromicrobium sp. TaxID=1871063 RepID=UPI003FA5A114
MEFLVEIDIRLPADMSEERRSELLADERARGTQLLDEGVLVDIWRIPGRLANVAIWKAVDATELHSAIATLPLFPWFDVRVTCLAVHPLRAPHVVETE